MKLNKISIFAASLACMTLASCSEGQYWTEPSDLGAVYAFAKPAETITIPTSESFPSSYDVTISRSTNVGESSAEVEFKSNSDQLTAPSKVTFADGSYTATYTISFGSDMELDVNYEAVMTLTQPADAALHVTKNNLKFTLNVKKPLIWNDLGWIAYTDGYLGGLYGFEPPTYYVPIQEHPVKSGYYRLVNPYGKYYPYNEPGDFNPNVTSYLYVNAMDKDGVYVETSTSTCNWGDGVMTFLSYVQYFLDGGKYTFDQIKAAGYCGTFADNKITFKPSTLLIYLGESLYYANTTSDESAEVGPFCLDFSTLTPNQPAAKPAAKNAKVSKTVNVLNASRYLSAPAELAK